MNTAKSCRFCSQSLSETFVDLGVSPVSNAYVSEAQLNQMEPFYPLHVYVCSACFLVQLQAFETPEQIFSEYAYFSSCSDSWLAHAEKYANQMTAAYALNKDKQVIEIASNDGYLLQYFQAQGVSVLGVEPSENVAEIAIQKGLPTRVAFFGCETASQLVKEGYQADLLVANNVLAHVPDLNDFVQGLKIVLKPTGVATLEFPHLLALMHESQFDTIYHEHFSYFSLTTVSQIFKAHGLEIFDVERLPTHGGSLRVYLQHTGAGQATSPVIQSILAAEKAAGLADISGYRQFSQQVKELKFQILSFLISARQAGKSIAAYGAPAKGNTLLNYCGIGPEFISYTVDRNTYKQGKYLPGTHLPIYSPDKIQQTKPDYLVILPWNLKDEISQQVAMIREWGGQFVTFVPEVMVF